MDYLGILVSSIASLAIGILVSRHFSSRKKLSWAIAKRKVLDPVGGNFPPSVAIFFDGLRVDRLSEWTVGIWNSGNRPVIESDLVDDLGLTLIVPNYTIIKVTTPETTRPAVNGRIDIIDNGTVSVHFALLDKNDGLVFTIYTDGGESSQNKERSSLNGDVIGVPGGPDKVATPDITRGRELILMLFSINMTGFLSTICALVAIDLIQTPTDSDIYSWILTNFGDQSLARAFEFFIGALAAIGSIFFSLVVILGLFILAAERFQRTPTLIESEFSRLIQRRRAMRSLFYFY